MNGRIRFRSRWRSAGHGGATYDLNALAYINATGALFPDALNDLVLGIKSAGLWNNHLGSIKFGFGVPSLAASMIDLRNTAFNGTAVNNPTHSATGGWTFVAASSQFIDTGWRVGATDSKASQNSSHYGVRLRGGSPGFWTAATFQNPHIFGFVALGDGAQQYGINDNGSPTGAKAIAAGTHFIATRTDASATALYGNGLGVSTSVVSSSGTSGFNVLLGGLNNGGTPGSFVSARFTCVHAGSGLDASQTAMLTALIDEYAVACGET